MTGEAEGPSSKATARAMPKTASPCLPHAVKGPEDAPFCVSGLGHHQSSAADTRCRLSLTAYG